MSTFNHTCFLQSLSDQSLNLQLADERPCNNILNVSQFLHVDFFLVLDNTDDFFSVLWMNRVRSVTSQARSVGNS